jgi:chemotaxis protein histidine kinase CheA
LALREIYRQVHTFKGLFDQFSFPRTPRLLDMLEDRLAELLEGNTDPDPYAHFAASAADILRVLDDDLAVLAEAFGPDFAELSDRVTISGEQAMRLRRLAAQLLAGETIDPAAADIHRLLEDMSRLGKISLREALVGYDRLVGQVAERLRKRVAPLAMTGDIDLRICPERFRPLLRSLVHVFRNAVVHGIEDPAIRKAAGKDEQGQIRCRAEREGGRMRLVIADDGGGVDIAVLHRKAAERALTAPDGNVLDLIFRDGVSTRSAADILSGRGVGLAALRAEAERLGGTATVRSEPGRGTEFIIDVPLE